MQKNKKIIVHGITSLKVGGAEAVLVDLVRALGNADYEHHVIYFYDGPNVARLKELGAHMHRIKGLVCRYDPFFFMRLYWLVYTLQPHVIHSSLWAANFLMRIIGKLTGILTINAIHSMPDIDGALRNVLDRYTVRYADHVVAISGTVERSLSARAWVRPAQLCTIKNGIDHDHVLALKNSHAQQRAAYGFNDHHVVIGMVGRFVALKNFPLLIQAFKEVYRRNPDVRLLLVGQGPHEAELRTLVHALQLDDVVTFVTGKMAYGYYALMDIFVLPSAQEGLSIALLEALSCGLPAVVAHDGALHSMHDVIRSGENGFLIPAGNEACLVDALARLAQDKELRNVLGSNACADVEKSFSVIRMSEAYGSLYNLK